MILFPGQRIGEFYTVVHQVTELANIHKRDKAGLDHAAYIQVADPLGILTVGFVALLMLCVLGASQRNPAVLFKDIECGYSVFSCGFRANV